MLLESQRSWHGKLEQTDPWQLTNGLAYLFQANKRSCSKQTEKGAWGLELRAIPDACTLHSHAYFGPDNIHTLMIGDGEISEQMGFRLLPKGLPSSLGAVLGASAYFLKSNNIHC